MTIEVLKIKFKEALGSKDINQYKFLLTDAMKYIGHTNPKLRDELILEYLFKLFIEGELGENLLIQVTYELLDNLNEGIDRKSDLIFKRTFSMLAIVALIQRHQRLPWMKDEIQRDIINRSVSAFSNEKDMRGYINNKGWAHAGAHGADMLLAISKLESVSRNDLTKMLDVIYFKLCYSDYAFNLDEDKRMARAVSGMFEHIELDSEVIEIWLKSFLNIERESIQRITAKSNARNFLTALRVYMKKDEFISKQCEELIEELVLNR